MTNQKPESFADYLDHADAMLERFAEDGGNQTQREMDAFYAQYAADTKAHIVKNRQALQSPATANVQHLIFLRFGYSALPRNLTAL